MTERRFRATVAAAYSVIGLAIFAPILNTGFVADDWEFLTIVKPAKSVLVCFQPLVGRFVRPWVILTYYVNYNLFGLWTLPYHVTLVAIHVLNAWLVCALTARVATSRPRITAAAAGLLFLVFAGHTEAVTWVAGVADPALLPFLLGGLLAMARALEAERPLRWIAAGWLAFVGAMFGKETSVVFPALALAFGAFHVLRTTGGSDGRPSQARDRRRTIVRTLAFVSVPAALVILYFVMRAVVFGTPFGAYAGLGTSTGIFFSQARAFLLRTFLPPLPLIASLWVRGLDLLLVLAPAAVALALVLYYRPRERAALLFSIAGVAIALAPALPLTISVINTESERYVYVASAFSSMLVALCLMTDRRRILGAAALVVLLLGHVAVLQRSNRAWREAAAVFDGVTASFARAVEARDGNARALALMLNMPDNVRGAYVFRNGFGSAIRIRYPHLAPWVDRTRFIATHNLITRRDRITIAPAGRHAYSVDIAPNQFLQEPPPSTVHYTFTAWERTRYTVELEDNVWSPVIFAAMDGEARVIDEFAGEGAPFGVVDIPQDPAVCPAATARFSGWALDDEEVIDVEVARDPFAGEVSKRPDGLVPLATATWATGTRPDVESAYRGFPHVQRAEWNYYLPCAAVAAAPGGAMRVHVIAADGRGHRAEIGIRTIRSR